MAELDFDELDKAVSSLMSDPKQPPKEQPAETAVASPEETSASTSEAESTEAVSNAPGSESSTPQQTEESITEKGQKSLATKRRGQFMDMKHPSANMKTPQVPNKAPNKAPHVGVTIAPLADASSSTPNETGEPEVEQKPEIEVPEVPVPVQEHETTENDSPEPAEDKMTAELEPEQDSEQATVEEVEESVEVQSVAQVEAEQSTSPEPEQELSEDLATDQAEPATAPSSPFLADAKVEKRPLGSALPEVEELGDGSSVDASGVLPDELHDSVLAVEADTTITTTPTTPEEPAEATEETHLDEPTPEVEANTQTSIPNQYKTSAPETAEEEKSSDTSLYDSAGEHDAFAAAPKRSHWVIVLSIIVIIVLGAAVGAGAYVLQAGLI